MSVAASPPILSKSIGEATPRSFGFVTVVAAIAAAGASLVLLIWFGHLDGVPAAAARAEVPA